jgi:heterotetrameric sarcosine oxidase gamma subunit
VPELIAKAAIEAEALYLGGSRLSLREPGTLTLIAPFPGLEEAVSTGLQPMGLCWPPEGVVCRAGEVRLIRAGQGQALVMGGVVPALIGEHAAISDQSDAWTCVELRGASASDALSRLVAIDLRKRAFGPGCSACTSLGQIPLLLIREAAADETELAGETELFDLLVPRSMTLSAWRALSNILHNLEARRSLLQR